MEERRKSKRLEIEVSVQLERLDLDDITTLKYLKVNVTDISKDGIGFDTTQELVIGSYYDVKIQIWTKEIINTVIEVVRVSEEDGSYHCGAKFVGLTERDALKIDVYQLFNDL